MRAQVLTVFNAPYVFTDTHPSPRDPRGFELLLRVTAASYCHTDAVFASGAMPHLQALPRIGSHEFAGVVERLGAEAARLDKVRVGEVVGVPGRAFAPCGTCEECARGEAEGDGEGYGVWCARAGNLGLSVDGGFQEFCLVDVRQVARVRGGMSAVDVAPLMCAGVTVWNALEKAGAGILDGDGDGRHKTVCIVGAGGGLGHLGVQFAAKKGWKVVAVDVTAAMGMLADVVRELDGGDGDGDGQNVWSVDALKEGVQEAKTRIFGAAAEGLEGEQGCDAALILPESQSAFDFGMGMLKNHGRCVVVSFPAKGWHLKPADLVFRHIDLVGVLTGRNHQLQAMLDFAAERNVRAKIRTYPLEKLNELVEDYHKGVGGKLVVDMDAKP